MKYLKLFEQFVNEDLKSESLNEGFKKFSDAFSVLDFFGGALPNDYNKARAAANKAGYDLPTSLYDQAAHMAQDGETEDLHEGRIAINHVYANAPVRNKVLEILKNGKVTEEEFMAAVSKAGAPSKWISRNSHFFKIEEEDGVKFYSLSKTGHVIMRSINENFKTEDVFFIWDETIDDDRKGIEQGHTNHKGKPAIRYDFYLPLSKKKMFSDFEEETKDFLKKKGLKYDWEGDSLFVYESVDVNEASNFGKPAGLSKEETLKIAQKVADAISKVEGSKCTVNKKSVDEDSFDLDIDGEEYAGGSYNLYDNGNIVNHAIGNAVKEPIYGNWKKDDVNAMIKKIKAIESQLNESEVEISGDFEIDENLIVDPLDLTQDFFYVSINGKVYGYQAKPGGSIEDVATTFKKMLKYSAGKALAWLKKNSELASGSKKAI
jgi:hypothetical protein